MSRCTFNYILLIDKWYIQKYEHLNKKFINLVIPIFTINSIYKIFQTQIQTDVYIMYSFIMIFFLDLNKIL